MCQNDSNIKTKQFKQITLEDRLLIEHLSNKQKHYRNSWRDWKKQRLNIKRNKNRFSRIIKLWLKL